MRKGHKSKAQQWIFCAAGLVLLFVFLRVLVLLFGEDSVVTNFYKSHILYTPYNIVGMIILPLAVCGIWLGKRTCKKIFLAVSWISTALSALPFFPLLVNKQSIAVEQKIKTTWFSIVAFLVWAVLIVFLIIAAINFIKSRMYRQEESANVKENGVDNDSKDSRSSDTEVINKMMSLFKPDNPSAETAKHKRKPRKKKVSANNNKNSNAQKTTENEQLEETKTEEVADVRYSHELHLIAQKICPQCGGKLKSRQNHETKDYFIGCENYFTSEQCKFTIDYAEFKQIEREIMSK